MLLLGRHFPWCPDGANYPTWLGYDEAQRREIRRSLANTQRARDRKRRAAATPQLASTTTTITTRVTTIDDRALDDAKRRQLERDVLRASRLLHFFLSLCRCCCNFLVHFWMVSCLLFNFKHKYIIHNLSRAKRGRAVAIRGGPPPVPAVGFLLYGLWRHVTALWRHV